MVYPVSFDALFEFEFQLGKYTGAPYVVVTDGCTHAIELTLRYKSVYYTEFPAHTYLSIPQTMKQLGIRYTLHDELWTGEYRFRYTDIWDSARRLQRGMYRPGQMQCLSFGISKPIHLGKVGAILLDDLSAYQTLSRMRSDGRDLRIKPWQEQKSFSIGYHYCPTLEDCERGIQALSTFQGACQTVAYPDCRQIIITVDNT